MKLIITASIKKAEFDQLSKAFSLKVIKESAKKSLKGLGANIKGSSKISNTCLKKLYLTSPGGAGRILFLLEIKIKKSVLVMIRLKNDKQVGSNMTIKNSKFKKALDKNLDLILEDITNGNYEEYNLK